eukprot:206729_1
MKINMLYIVEVLLVQLYNIHVKAINDIIVCNCEILLIQLFLLVEIASNMDIMSESLTLLITYIFILSILDYYNMYINMQHLLRDDYPCNSDINMLHIVKLQIFIKKRDILNNNIIKVTHYVEMEYIKFKFIIYYQTICKWFICIFKCDAHFWINIISEILQLANMYTHINKKSFNTYRCHTLQLQNHSLLIQKHS